MKELNQFEYSKFKKCLFGKIIQIIFGYILGCYILSPLAASAPLNDPVFWGFVCSGVPYAWSKIPITMLSLPGLAIKLFFSMLLGLIITPIALTYDLIQFFRYRRKVKKDKKLEKEELELIEEINKK